MKKFVAGLVIALISLSYANADDVFKAKQENMKAKVTDKLTQSSSKEAQEFGKKKLDCIGAATTEEALKACKDKFPPQEMDALLKK